MTTTFVPAQLSRAFWLYWAGVALTALGDAIGYVAQP